jgi:hypothetical protein
MCVVRFLALCYWIWGVLSLPCCLFFSSSRCTRRPIFLHQFLSSFCRWEPGRLMFFISASALYFPGRFFVGAGQRARSRPCSGFGFLVTAVSEFACRCAKLVLLSRSSCALTPKIGFAAGFLLRFLLQKSTSAGGSVFSSSKSRPGYSYWILCCRGCLTATVFLYRFPFLCFPVLRAWSN